MIKPVTSYSVSNLNSTVRFSGNPVRNVASVPTKLLKKADIVANNASKEGFCSMLKNIISELFPTFDKEYRNLFK
jgi:hypothetical protein